MQPYRMTLAYDGTDYSGWQYQPDRPTIQAVIENALFEVTGTQTRIIASGRTDAGVHALGQVAAFRCLTHLGPDDLTRALNAKTPADIHIWKIEYASDDFHPIRDAIAKRYRYVIHDGPQRDLFARRYAWHLPRRLDVGAMRVAAEYLIGRHDFRSFQSAGAPRKSTVRTVSELTISRECSNHVEPIAIEIQADGFLYNMVRNIVGTLVQVGLSKRSPESLADVLAACDRRVAGPTAPAHGLTLWQVFYAD